MIGGLAGFGFKMSSEAKVALARKMPRQTRMKVPLTGVEEEEVIFEKRVPGLDFAGTPSTADWEKWVEEIGKKHPYLHDEA